MKLIAIIVAFAALAVGAQPVEYKGLRLGATVDTLAPWLSNAGLKCEPTAGRCRVLPIESCDFPMPNVRGTSTEEFSRQLRERGEKFRECTSAISAKQRFAGIFTGPPRLAVADGVIASLDVGFMGEKFGEMLAAVTEKYGPPTSLDNEPWKNKAGATFDNRVAVWRRPDGVIRLVMRGEDRDGSLLSMLATGVEESRAAARKDAAKKAVGDM